LSGPSTGVCLCTFVRHVVLRPFGSTSPQKERTDRTRGVSSQGTGEGGRNGGGGPVSFAEDDELNDDMIWSNFSPYFPTPRWQTPLCCGRIHHSFPRFCSLSLSLKAPRTQLGALRHFLDARLQCKARPINHLIKRPRLDTVSGCLIHTTSYTKLPWHHNRKPQCHERVHTPRRKSAQRTRARLRHFR